MDNGNGRIIEVPLNRVEGDLEIWVETNEGTVTDAWSAGTMYRGIENMLRGRGARDGLVITPRICGICGTAHLVAAAKALEAIAGVTPPPNALIVRNLALMTEQIQSDIRHAMLMFMVDFANPAYAGHEFFDEATRRYEPFKGTAVIEAVNETKHIIEIIALLGGQWPHSTYMVPGGVTSQPTPGVIAQCSHLLQAFGKWYERSILGSSIGRFAEIDSLGALDAWLAESAAHCDSNLGFLVQVCRELGLDGCGRGHGNYLGYGQFDIPAGSAVQGPDAAAKQLLPAGFVRGTTPEKFDQALISEHVAASHYRDYEGGLHPFEGRTEPLSENRDKAKYSWAKAPRYGGSPAETGPLADLVIAGNPLLCDLVQAEGPNVMARELARLIRPAVLIPAMGQWLAELDPASAFYTSVNELPDGRGAGLTGATRGALGHWVEITAGRIEHYQIITPTAWNGSPRDAGGVRGPWEEALIGLTVRDTDNPVELGHVIRSFDACLVCTVHGLGAPDKRFRVQV